MKLITSICLVLLGWSFFAQPPSASIEKSINTAGVEKTVFEFKYPELIEIKGWEKEKIVIKGNVSINNGKNDDAFTINVEKEGSILTIKSEIENLDGLPRMVMVKKGDMEYYFNTDDQNGTEVREVMNQNGGDEEAYTSVGVMKKISLSIMVPMDMAIEVKSKFGLIDIKGFGGPVTADSKFGGVDIAIADNRGWDVKATTKFGEVYTDLEIPKRSIQSSGDELYKWGDLSFELNGGGQLLDITSKFGNVYLRKR